MGMNFGSARPCSPCMSPPPPPPPPPPACGCDEFSPVAYNGSNCVDVDAGTPSLTLSCTASFLDNTGRNWSGVVSGSLAFQYASSPVHVVNGYGSCLCSWKGTIQSSSPPSSSDTTGSIYYNYMPKTVTVCYLGSGQWYCDIQSDGPASAGALIVAGPTGLPISLNFGDTCDFNYTDGTSSAPPSCTTDPAKTVDGYIKYQGITANT